MELRGSVFYLRDGLMQLWLALVADAIHMRPDAAPWLTHVEADLRYQATIVFNGLLAARLDGHLETDAHLAQFVDMCEGVRHALNADHFTPGPLAAEVGRDRWTDEMPARLVRVTDAVLWIARQESP